MDGSQFDTFARLASEARTRRMALLTALGGLHERDEPGLRRAEWRW